MNKLLINRFFGRLEFYRNRAKMRDCKLTHKNIQKFRLEFFKDVQLSLENMLDLMYRKHITAELVINKAFPLGTMLMTPNINKIWTEPIIILSGIGEINE